MVVANGWSHLAGKRQIEARNPEECLGAPRHHAAVEPGSPDRREPSPGVARSSQSDNRPAGDGVVLVG